MSASSFPPTTARHSSASAISSVLNQTVTDLELIIVDDGSTDGTLREIERFEDPRVVVIRHATNQGVSRATNAGLARARGRYLAALAADDLWLPAKLERQLAQLESRAISTRATHGSSTWTMPAVRCRRLSGMISDPIRSRRC